MIKHYRIGDVVKYVGSPDSWTVGEEHIIAEPVYHGNGEFEYSTNQGAWFSHDDFVLVHEATPESLEQLLADADEEKYGDDDEWEGDK